MALPELVASKAARKSRARRVGAPNPWSGLGMFGVIGWSVSVPTVAGAALGVWIDRHHTGGRSYTLALLVVGLILGCATAGHWIAAQNAALADDSGPADE